MAGTGGTSSPFPALPVSSLGFGVERREEDMTPEGRRGNGLTRLTTELKLVLEDNDWPEP